MDPALVHLDHDSTRVARTFGFLDLCGFTDFVDTFGDAAGVRELQLLRTTIREVAPLCAVRVDKWLGDGVMLVAVEPEPLVTAVLAIRRRASAEARLPIRGGVAAGDVILLEGDDYVGSAVNLAARLCDRAGPGQILAAGESLVVPAWVDARPVDVAAIRGFADSVTVVALDEEHVPAAAGPASTLLSLVDGLARPVRQLRPRR